jgi:hypothetical protein
MLIGELGQYNCIQGLNLSFCPFRDSNGLEQLEISVILVTEDTNFFGLGVGYSKV